MKKDTHNSNPKKQYYYATASRRILAKLFDIILLIGINIGIFFLFTFSIVDWSMNAPVYNHLFFSLAFSSAILLDMMIWFLYFCVLPYLWKGYTVFYKVFKLKLHCIKKRNKITYYIKHELFLWLPMFITIFLIAIVSFAFDNPIDFLLAIILANNQSVSQTIQIVAGIFDFLIVLSAIFIIGVIINTIANSFGVSFIDNYANLRVVHLIAINEDKNNQKLKISKDLPGMIDIEELDNL